MKKNISFLLIITTLISGCCKYTYAKGDDSYTNSETHHQQYNSVDLINDPQFDAAIKNRLLELSKDKKFTDKIVRNYEKSHQEAIWMTFVKFPFRLIWKTIKITFNYIIGKNVAECLAKVIPIALLALDARYKFTATKTILSWIKYILLPH